MAPQRTLTVTALVSILLFSLHWADEIARGIEPGTLDRTWGGLLILFVWLSATIAPMPRRWGLVVLMLGGALASGVPVLHMQGHGLMGGRITPNGSGALFWVWTNVALGVTGAVSAVLAARALWQASRRP